MQAGILIISHGRLGHELLENLAYVLGEAPGDALALAVDSDRPSIELEAEAKSALGQLDNGAGVLVLTDLVGATPANLATGIAGENVAVIAGVNLSMLVRVMNYRSLPLHQLVDKALSGGRDGVVRIKP